MANTNPECCTSELFDFWSEVSVDEADEFPGTDRVLEFADGLGFVELGLLEVVEVVAENPD